ncbi:MAG: hypothetical protein RLO01_12740 [Thalassobaculaceae bacterium]
MVAPLDDAMLGLFRAKERVVKAATGCGRVRQIDRDLTAAVTAVAAELRGRVPVDPTEPFGLVERFVDAGGDLDALHRAIEQRRFIERQEKQAP